MNLSKRLNGDFDATVRSRGYSYFRQGYVRILQGSASQVDARVRGSRQYQVSLDWEDGVLVALCDCPYFGSDGACKHIWATILASDARGYLSAASGPDVVLDCDGIEDDGWEDAVVPTRPPKAAVPKPAPPPPPPAWKKQILNISGGSVQASRPRVEWPEKRQIVYVVDVPGSASAGDVLLKLLSRDHKMDGSYTRDVGLSLKRRAIGQLPLPEDREIVSALSGGVQYFGWGYMREEDQVPESCLVSHPLSATIMPLAARTGRCYLRNGKDSSELIPLTWDDGGPWAFGLRCALPERDGEWRAFFGVARSEWIWQTPF